uniref:Uncharacterized protein n=2 Tax=Micrurus TaxID=8634 RepID=A0A2D4F2H8_MICCO
MDMLKITAGQYLFAYKSNTGEKLFSNFVTFLFFWHFELSSSNLSANIEITTHFIVMLSKPFSKIKIKIQFTGLLCHFNFCSLLFCHNLLIFIPHHKCSGIAKGWKKENFEPETVKNNCNNQGFYVLYNED